MMTKKQKGFHFGDWALKRCESGSIRCWSSSNDQNVTYFTYTSFVLCFVFVFSSFFLAFLCDFFQYRLGGLVSPTKRYKRIPLSLSLRKKTSVFYLQFSFVVVVSNASACKLSSVQVIPITSKVVFLKARTTTM